MKSEDCPGLSVTLQAAGADLLEYAVGEEGDEADTSKRYVEVVAGSNFSVGIQYDRAFLYPQDTIEVRAWLDGQYADGICSNPKKRRSSQIEAIDGINSLQNGRWVIQKLQFAALTTDDGLPKASMNDTLKELERFE
ncbi:hypothetical protein B0A55_11922 [Friedmanniomyces simplex]|uniref:DUF7918 domain-containing protein n=1 Tax=Friedmanniomyces simplex TaxID=329884 RepID=A0A4U0VNA6_9PEZI|nr:hypothetical protein B0A55_11922 [Friedmanniomyces simplex]